MIGQGTDGLSRGDLSNGVMPGDHFLKWVPLNKTTFQRQALFREWIYEVLPGVHWKGLSTEEWYTTALTDGRFIWTPAPAIANVAVEKLCEARHIRPGCSHVFVCPAIVTAYWRKQLGKVADVMFTIPVGTSIWPSEMHEPLVAALICPLLSCRPWRVRGSPWMVEFKVRCVGCGAVISKLNGVICGNFGCARGHGPGRCANVWHGKKKKTVKSILRLHAAVFPRR